MPSDQTFVERYEVMHIYIYEVPEEYVKYSFRYMTKLLKLKVTGDFWLYKQVYI